MSDLPLSEPIPMYLNIINLLKHAFSWSRRSYITWRNLFTTDLGWIHPFGILSSIVFKSKILTYRQHMPHWWCAPAVAVPNNVKPTRDTVGITVRGPMKFMRHPMIPEIPKPGMTKISMSKKTMPLRKRTISRAPAVPPRKRLQKNSTKQRAEISPPMLMPGALNSK